ncbi:MAG: o-succinylbenzoate--CoA ligase [Bacteroidetes bacterium OLB9]|nr:MAG: o-succinylbenzoate--CoA ligase [Bacteroidetes bacterium OLB9]
MEMWQQDWIAKWAIYSPNKIALQEHESGKAITYADLHYKACGIAAYLRTHHHIQKGDRIVVVAEFSIDYVALFSAAQKAGFIIVPVNYRLAMAEVKHIIEDAAPVLVLYDPHYAHILPHIGTEIILSEMVTAAGSTDVVTITQVEEDDAIFIIYTSGTTGKPKGVKYTHKMAFWNSINTAISLIVNTESRTVNVMPPFHTGGWNVLLLPFLHHGGFTYLCRKFDANSVLGLLHHQRCTLFMGVPTMLSMMAQDPDFEKADFSEMYYIIVGGESMPIPLIERYAEKGVAIRQGYGMTEVGPNLTSLHQDDAIRKKGSIGRTNFYVQHRVVKENGEDAQPNESGELWLRGPMVTPGYWHNEAATKSSFSEDGRWFKTGDIVREDADHYIYIMDRLKNMFISGAENVYPAEIEAVLRQRPEVVECAVIGVKDERWGEVGKAFVVVNGEQSEEKLRNHCLANLAKFKVPKYFVFLNDLPKSDSGKIDRKSLKLL